MVAFTAYMNIDLGGSCCMQVPAANVLGEVGTGAAVLMSGLDYERLILAALPVGMMEACLDLALKYAVQRKQFGQPIGEFQVRVQQCCLLLFTMCTCW
jgi:isovaleryl-CoA dehydrogenase